MHALGERLLGSQYAKKYVLSSIRNLGAPPLEQVLHTLDEHNLLFSIDSREGVLVLASDELLTDSMECLLTGPSRARVREIELLLLDSVRP
jgi:hypothetical protein